MFSSRLVRRLGASALVAVTASVATAPDAEARLTSSERAQAVGIVTVGGAGTADRARSLLARPDVDEKEASGLMEHALSRVTFDDKRRDWLDTFLGLPGTHASRDTLVPVVLRGLLARADAVLAKHQGDLDLHRDAMAELADIYAYIDGTFAGSMKTPRGFSPIPPRLRDHSAQIIASHLGRHARWLGVRSKLAPMPARARAQAMLALADLMRDDALARHGAAGRLGLGGTRRSVFIERGVMLLDSGDVGPHELERVAQVLDRTGASSAWVGAVFFGSKVPKLVSVRRVVGVEHAMGAPHAPRENVFPVDVAAGPVERHVAEVTKVLADELVRVAYARRPTLELEILHNLGNRAERVSSVSGPQRELARDRLASAITFWLVDAHRASAWIASRWLVRDAERAALGANALGILAAAGRRESHAGTLSVAVGERRLDGLVTTRMLEGVVVDTSGAATGWRLDDRQFVLTRDARGGIQSMAIDGKPPQKDDLLLARVSTTDAERWTEGRRTWSRLAGRARMGTSTGGRLRIVAPRTAKPSIVATDEPKHAYRLSANMSVIGGPSGVVVRATPTSDGFAGASVLVRSGPGSRRAVAELLVRVPGRREKRVAGPIELPAADAHLLDVHAHADRLDVHVDGRHLTATLPKELGGGRVGLRAAPGAELSTGAFAISKLPR